MGKKYSCLYKLPKEFQESARLELSKNRLHLYILLHQVTGVIKPVDS
jgi:hypothetical protein